MDKPKIGIIGMGFLGGAMAYGFNSHASLKCYDKYNNDYDSLEETVNESDYIFIGVPTPMRDDGSQDLSNMDDAIASIVEVAKSRKIIVLRSTVIPGTTRKYADLYSNHTFAFNPEFLSERTAKLDYLNTARIIIGGDFSTNDVLEGVFKSRFPHVPIYKTTWEGAEVVKYMSNCFSAVKISFMNEMYDIAKRIGISYDDLREMHISNGWVNPMHTEVPGHDGQRGFGGKCFPKDMSAFIDWAEVNELNLDMCKAAQKVNKRVREVEDWHDIKGATSKNNYE